MTLGKLLMRGYFLGLIGGLVGTTIATLIHITYYIIYNGFQIYLKHWDYPREMLSVGVAISFIASGITGIFLASLLWWEFKKGKLTLKGAMFNGGGLGLSGTLLLFGILLVSPIGAIYFRLNAWGQIIYFFGPILIGLCIGRWVGSQLAKFILKSEEL